MADATDPNEKKDPADPKPGDPPAKKPPQSPTAGDPDAGKPEATFTQADLDRIAGTARKDGKSAERAALLQALGVDSLEAAQVAIKAADDAKRAQMSESERLKTDKEAAEKRATDAEAARQRSDAERLQALMESEIVSLASSDQEWGRFANPKAVVKLIETKAIKFEDGQWVGVEAALKNLAEKETWTLAPKGGGTQTNIGITNGKKTVGARTDDDRRAEYFGGGKRRTFFEPSPDGVRGREK